MSDTDVNTYLRRNVHDLLSLKDRVIVITGAARGLGLAFAYAVAEAGGHIAAVDYLDTAHADFYKLQKESGVKVQLFK
jgi:sorbose reductase